MLQQCRQSLVRQLVAPLVEPVGEHDDGVPGSERAGGAAARHPGGDDPERQAAPAVQVPGTAVGPGQQDGRVPRAGVGELARAQVEPGVGQRGGRGAVDPQRDLVRHRQQAGRVGMVLGGHPQRAPELAHGAGRGEVVPDNVPHAESGAVTGQRDHVVPVAAHLQVGVRGPVGDADGQARDLVRLAQHRQLQFNRDLAVPQGQPPLRGHVLDDDHHLVGGDPDRLHLQARLPAGPDGDEHPPARGQRPHPAGVRGDHVDHLRCQPPQQREHAGQVAVGDDRGEQLHRGRVDHADGAGVADLEQADRALVEELQQVGELLFAVRLAGAAARLGRRTVTHLGCTARYSRPDPFRASRRSRPVVGTIWNVKP